MIYLLAFESTHASLAAQKQLNSLRPHVIPTPREIAAGCGMALRFNAKNDQCALEIVRQAAIDETMLSLYKAQENEYQEIKLTKT